MFPNDTRTKLCKTCGEDKHLSAYSVCNERRDGFRAECKVCAAARAKAWRLENRERYIQSTRDRYAANREENIKKARAYRIAHKDEIADKWRARYESNKEVLLERNRASYSKHRETRLAYAHAYRTEHNDRRAAYRRSERGRALSTVSKHNRRMRILARGGSVTTDDLAAIRAAQTDKQGRLICWRCGKPITSTPHLDHWIPIKENGAHDAGNLHFMHATCNLEKGSRLPFEIGRLI